MNLINMQLNSVDSQDSLPINPANREAQDEDAMNIDVQPTIDGAPAPGLPARQSGILIDRVCVNCQVSLTVGPSPFRQFLSPF